MVKGLACDLRGHGISANCIAPGVSTAPHLPVLCQQPERDCELHAGAIANSLPPPEQRGSVDGPIDPNWSVQD